MDRLRDLLQKFEQLSLRERGLIAAALLFALYQAWDLVWNQPQGRQMVAMQGQLQRDTESVRTTEQQLRQLKERIAASSESRYLEETERLRQQLQGTEQRIEAVANELISPSDMARLLEELLTRERGLSLLKLETLGSEQVIPALIETGTDSSPMSMELHHRVYRHGFAIEFQGAYLATLRYLEALDQLPWRFYWDGVQYTVDEHPRGRVRLELHTLSFSEGWIGV